MIKTITSFALMMMFLNTYAQVGDKFPAISGTTLEDKQVNIPEDTKGKFTLIGVAFSEQSEDNMVTWLNPVYNKFIIKHGLFDDEYDVNVYFIPMLTGANQLNAKGAKNFTKQNMDKGLIPYVVFYKGGMKDYKEPLRLYERDNPYIFLLDEEGTIVYATQGRYIDKKMDDIVVKLEEEIGKE